MHSRHFGIFALVSLFIILTVPSAFADVAEDNPAIQNSASNSNAAFKLMDLITNGQNEAASLSLVIENNGLNQSLLDDFTDALNEAAALAAASDLEGAQAALDKADALLDDVYDEIYDEVDSQQSVRYDNFVDDAIDSISTILDLQAQGLISLSPAVVGELEEHLELFQSGDSNAILGATGETSNIGLTFSMHPGFDNASPNNNGKGKGLGLGDADNLPPGLQKLPKGIKEKYQISTDSDVSTVSSDGETNDDGEDKLGFVDKKLEQGGLPFGFEKKFESGDLPRGFETKLDGIKALANGDVDSDVIFALPNGFVKKFEKGGLDALPKGFLKKAVGDEEFAGIFLGGDDYSIDDSFEDLTEDDGTKDKKKNDKKDKKLKKDKKNKCPPGQAKKGNC